jgi:hypothetical protein
MSVERELIAIQLVELGQIPDDFRITQASGALSVQFDATLIFRYAADEPGAVAEVRSQHGLE